MTKKINKNRYAKTETFLGMPSHEPDITWGEWLQQAFLLFLNQGEGFNSKRPLGDSGWEFQLRDDMKQAGIHPKEILSYLFEARNILVEKEK